MTFETHYDKPFKTKLRVRGGLNDPPPTLGVLGESQSLSFLQEAYGMGLVHCKGEDTVLLLLRCRGTLGVLHAEPGLRILEV